MIAACSETGVPVLKIGIDPTQKAPRPMQGALARALGAAEFTSAEVGQGLVRFHLGGTDHRTVPAAMPSHRLTCALGLLLFLFGVILVPAVAAGVVLYGMGKL